MKQNVKQLKYETRNMGDLTGCSPYAIIVTMKTERLPAGKRRKMTPPDSKLNPMQSRFVEEYLVDLCGTQAAIRAGYSPRSARIQSAQLLTRPNVTAAIKKGMDKLSAKVEITQERVLRELICFAFFDPKDLFRDDGSIKPIKDMPESARRAIAGLEVTEAFDVTKGGKRQTTSLLKKIRLVPKQSGIDLLMQYLGMIGKLTTSKEIDDERITAALEKIAAAMSQ